MWLLDDLLGFMVDFAIPDSNHLGITFWIASLNLIIKISYFENVV